MPDDPSTGANIRSKTDLTSLCEVETIETGAFVRCTFSYIDEHDRAWFGQAKDKREYDLTVQDLNRLLQRVPDEKIYPLQTPALSVVPEEIRSQCYIKRPKLLCLDDEDEAKLLPRLLLGEADEWIDEDYATSAQSHDELAAHKIEVWLQSKAQVQH
jgi:hypothetical protein